MMKTSETALGTQTRHTLERSVASQVLRWLLQYPFLSVEDLTAALGYSHAQCYRSVAELQRSDLIQAVGVPALGMSRARLYHLTRNSVFELAKGEGTDVNVFARRFHADEPHLLALLVRSPALVAVQTLIRALVTQAPVALASAHHPCRISWSWERDFRLSVPVRNGERRMPLCLVDAHLVLCASPTSDGGSHDSGSQPDQQRMGHGTPVPAGPIHATGHATGEAYRSAVETTAGGRWYEALVLYDDGVMPERILAQRLLTLLRCREAPERWMHGLTYSTFPSLLVLAHSGRRADRWRVVARSITAHAGMDPIQGGVLVATASSLANPWNAGWSPFEGATPRRLTELLTPGPSMPPMWTRTSNSHEQKRADANTDGLHSGEQVISGDTRVSETVSLTSPMQGMRHINHIIGNYTQRAHQGDGRSDPFTTKGKGRRSASSRSQLTLMSLRLGARHLDMLRLLLDHPLLNRVELAAALAVDEESAARYLSDLRREGLVSAITARPGTLGWSASVAAKFSQPCLSYDETNSEWAKRQICRRDDNAYDRYFVSEAGIRLLAAGARIRPRSLAHPATALQHDSVRRCAQHTTHDEGLELAYRGYGADGELGSHPYLRYLLRYPAHTAGVYAFFAALLRSIERERLHGRRPALLWWETGAGCIRRYYYQECWRNFRPDGVGEYVSDRSSGHRIAFWLEWDRATMGIRDLQAKFTSYAAYIGSREWKHDGAHSLPRLLVVTTDYAHQSRLTGAWETTLSYVPGLTIFQTTAIQVTTGDPLGAIWRQWLPSPESGRSLGQPCRIYS